MPNPMERPVRRPYRAAVYPSRRGRAACGSGAAVAATLALALGPAVSTGCVTNPVTGRSSLNVFSTQDDMKLGADAFAEIKADPRVVRSGPEKALVERCMQRLVASIPAEQDPGYPWEIVLIEDDATVNAFALPGGKMAVYTGILPICQDETGLAVVMGHEIGHVIARHGTSRLTSSLGAQTATGLLDGYLGGNAQAATELTNAVLGLGLLAYGRGDESDADHTGLVYMARAGYDPRESTAFWSRMAQLGGGAPPEFLSTHPSHETRVERLTALMPEAVAIYEGRASAP